MMPVTVKVQLDNGEHLEVSTLKVILEGVPDAGEDAPENQTHLTFSDEGVICDVLGPDGGVVETGVFDHECLADLVR
jgi:hypothetical protein